MIRKTTLWKRNRSGILYIHVMFTAIVVTVIAVATMRFHRSQAHELRMGQDYAASKRYANAAIDIAMLQMRKSTNWRTLNSNGSWATLLAMEKGFYSITVTDPVDGDLADDSNDPVDIQVEGRSGKAIYRLKVRVNISPADGSCLDVALMAGGNFTFSKSNVTTDQIAASNGSSDSSGSEVNSDIETVSEINGKGYKKSKTSSVDPRKLPIAGSVASLYYPTANYMAATALPLFTQSELIGNTTFESGISGWSALPGASSCTLVRSNAKTRSGTYALLVKNRSNEDCTAGYTINLGNPSLLKILSCHSYELTMPIYVSKNADVKVVCSITDGSNNTVAYGADEKWSKAKSNTSEQGGYDHPSMTFRPIFTGQISKVEIKVLFKDKKDDYYIDDPTLKDVSYPLNSYVFDRNVLAPTLNPYGAANGSGIYRIDCSGKNVVFGYSRVVGTVILDNPGPLSGIYGPVDWQPMVPNLPAIISTGSIVISMTDFVPNEAESNANFNPTGAPMPFEGGSSDTDQLDSYASIVRGIIYATSELKVEGRMNVAGLAISNSNMTFQDATVVVNYDRKFAEDPPPGFDVGLIDINIEPGSWKRVVQ